MGLFDTDTAITLRLRWLVCQSLLRGSQHRGRHPDVFNRPQTSTRCEILTADPLVDQVIGAVIA